MERQSIYIQVEQIGISVMHDVFAPILNRDVTIKVKAVEEAELARLKGAISESPVVIETSLDGFLRGTIYYICSQRFAAAITDMMVMGDGTAAFNEQESLDGIAEVFNQINGALSSFWGEEFKTQIRPGGAEAKLVRWDEFKLPLKEKILVEYEISIADWGETQFFKLVPRQIMETLTQIPELDTKAAAQEEKIQPAVKGEKRDLKGAEKTIRPAEFAAFEDVGERLPAREEPKNLDLLLDISLPVTIELGRTTMLISDVLELGPGSVIELQKLSGEPVDLYINDKKFALGEVVVIDENFGIRITELLNAEERLKALK